MQDKGSILIGYRGHFIALEKWQAGARRRQKIRRIVKAGIGAMFVLMVIIAGVCGHGCGPSASEIEESAVAKKADARAVEACYAQGGIPLRSFWDGRIKDCVKPREAR